MLSLIYTQVEIYRNDNRCEYINRIVYIIYDVYFLALSAEKTEKH